MHDAGNYTIANTTITVTGDITAKSVAITAGTVAVTSKTYDGTTAATITGSAATTDFVGGDTVSIAGTLSGTYDTKAIGTGKTVTVGGYSLTGADAGNYTIANSTITVNGNITSKSVTITAGTVAVTSKTYDGTTAATITGSAATADFVGGDTVSITGTLSGTYDTKAIGTGKTVTVGGYSLTGADAGNYTIANSTITVTGNITAKSVTITAGTVAVTSKTYDGTTAATITGAADYSRLCRRRYSIDNRNIKRNIRY